MKICFIWPKLIATNDDKTSKKQTSCQYISPGVLLVIFEVIMVTLGGFVGTSLAYVNLLSLPLA
jgi:inner membrane protein involved in colicin E2 resistance